MRDLEPTIRSRELGRGLREAMNAAGLDGKSLASSLGWAQSRVSRLLNGKRLVREIDVAAFLALCGVTGTPHERLLRLCREENSPGSMHQRGARLPKRLGRAADYEANASRITDFSCVVVPTLLQTGGYARACLAQNVTSGHTTVGGALAAVLARSGALVRPSPPECTFFLHEWVLRTPVGGRTAMSEQLHHLLRVSVLPFISIRIVPIVAGAHPATSGAFTLLDFASFRSVVYRQEEHSDVFLENEAEVTDYRRIAHRLGEVAWPVEASRMLVADLAKLDDRPTCGPELAAASSTFGADLR